MATVEKEHKAAAKPTPVEGVPVAPVTGPVPLGLNDRREDGAPVLGAFVEVTEGEHQGTYGVFLGLEGDTAIIRARDETGQRLTVPFALLRASRAGKR